MQAFDGQTLLPVDIPSRIFAANLHARTTLPVDAPSPIPVAQLVQMWCNILNALESIDNNVVDDVAPQHDIAPGGHPLPLIGRAKPPCFQNVLHTIQ